MVTQLDNLTAQSEAGKAVTTCVSAETNARFIVLCKPAKDSGRCDQWAAGPARLTTLSFNPGGRDGARARQPLPLNRQERQVATNVNNTY